MRGPHEDSRAADRRPGPRGDCAEKALSKLGDPQEAPCLEQRTESSNHSVEERRTGTQGVE